MVFNRQELAPLFAVCGGTGGGATSSFRRFPTLQVPRPAVVSCVASHRSRGVQCAATGLGSVAFEFDRLRARFFAVRSERERCVAYPGAGVPAYGQTYGRLEGLLAFASPASPRVALAAS